MKLSLRVQLHFWVPTQNNGIWEKMSYEGEQIDPVNHGKIPAGTATASDRAPSSTAARKPPRAPALAGTESFSKLPAGERVTGLSKHTAEKDFRRQKVDWQQAFDHRICTGDR